MTDILRPPTNFISLHSHSHFSTYDGLGQPGDHIDFCVKNGLSGWSLTDHGNGNGLAHAHAHAKKLKSKGTKFRQLYGVEFYFVPDLVDWKVRYDLSRQETTKGDDEEEAGLVVEDADETRSDGDRFVDVNKRYHLVVVAKNGVGLSNLFTLVKKSYVDGFYKFPRIDFRLLKEHGEGLVVSTACVGGYPSGLIYGEFPDKKFAELTPDLVDDRGVRSRIRNRLENMVDRFVDCVGQENFFLELQFNKLSAQDLTNRMMLEVAASTGCKLLSTADSHYPEPALWEAREIYRQLQPGRMKIGVEPKPLPTREELKAELYPKNAQQMWDEYLSRRAEYSWYEGTEDAVRTSIENGHDVTWNLCQEVWFDTSAKLPTFDTPERSGFKQLVDLVKEGLRSEGLDSRPEYVERAKMELDDIRYLKSEDYFLTLQKVFKLAENRTLPGSGRGSGAGSLVNYLLGITHVDPLKYDLLWERFMGRHRCLDPATLIKTPTGNKPIADVNVGDEVVSGNNRPQKVKSKFLAKHKSLMKLTIGKQRITCSPNHRWIVLRDCDEIEVFANDITTSDFVRTITGDYSSVSSAQRIEFDDEKDLIDIEVENDHTFFVSQDGTEFVLTHNSGYPDIDTDVGDRDKLIEAAREIFGNDAVVPVSNFNTLKLKSLVKDVSKFYGVPFDEVNAMTGPLEREVEMKSRDPNMEKSMFVLKHEDCMEHSENYRNFMAKYPQVEEKIRTLFMMNRSVGRHAGGVLICPGLEKHMPLITVRGELQTPWTEGVNIRNLEENGFLKFDFLGIKQMKMVEDCIARILKRELGRDPLFSEVKKFYDDKINCRYVEPNDDRVLDHVYRNNRWPGIFQFTSDGARKFCHEVQPTSIEDIGVVTAIYRPGPLKANVHKKYVEAKKDASKVKYDHPTIKEVLGNTYGFIAFQEQFMLLAQKLAGFTPGESDKMRKTLVKKDLTSLGKKSEEKEALEKKFVDGCVTASGMDRGKAKELFDKIAFFSLYGFNKSLYFLQKVNIIRDGNEMDVTIEDVTPGDMVMTRDEKTGENFRTSVIEKHDHGTLDLFEIVLGTGEKVTCTMDHKFRTKCGRMLPLKKIIEMDLEIVTRETVAKIVDVKYAGQHQTYDLEVDHPDHQFYLSNGVLTSNSHAIAYAIDSYYGAWLMTYYETDWLATCLQSENSNVESLAWAMSEIKQLGYAISQPDINHSSDQWQWSDKLQAFVPPLSSLKGVGDSAVVEIMNNRPYRCLDDLLFDEAGNWRHSKFNRKAMAALISMEALSSLEEFSDGRVRNHKQLWAIIMDNFDTLRKGRWGTTSKKALKAGGLTPVLDRLLEETEGMEDWDRYEKLAIQTETSGAAPFHLIFPAEVLEKVKKHDVPPISELPEGTKGVTWFCVTSVEKKTTKNGKVFMRLKTLDTTLTAKSLRVWGDFDIAPYSIWLGIVSHEADWGYSTNAGKLREVA